MGAKPLTCPLCGEVVAAKARDSGPVQAMERHLADACPVKLAE